MERKVITGDLLDETFTHLETYINHERKISGWEVDLGDGGTYDYAFAEWFKLIDQGKGRGIRMSKKFVLQEEGRITLEYRFKMPVKLSATAWEIRSGEDVALRVYTCKKAIWYGDSIHTEILLSEYEDDVEYGVKVEADIDTNLAEIYINGILKASGVRFVNYSAYIDNILITTGGTDKGEVYINPVRIYKGYILCERFLTCTPGNVPYDWTATNLGGTGSSQEFRCSSAPDIYSYKMENTTSTQGVTLIRNFSPVGDKLVFEYRFLLPIKIDGMGMILSNNGDSIIAISTLDGSLCISCLDGGQNKIQSYCQNLWYHIRLEADLNNGRLIVHVNGKKKYSSVLGSVDLRLDSLKFHTSDQYKGILWVDDILLYKALQESEDYVPKPIPVNGGSCSLGMQVCSLWREGHHNGWDFIKPYLERKPYLGWYEEGTPEVSDWEIKWMVEHGVDFQFYCWYRPGMGLGNPIKNPLADYNLHDGYFYAKYSHMLKFAIMFENGNTKCDGFDDLINNLIPFWIEYYIKDPRYFSMDNKPVFGIYSVDGLIRDFGGIEGAKKAIKLIRQAIVEVGFNEVIMLCECREKDIELIKKIKDVGFDCIYSYTWYTGDIQIQKEKMQEQKNTGIIDLLPTLSMGWHTQPWGGTEANWASPEEFEDLSCWVRDELIPSTDSNSLGRRLIMLDNWNEFGEGHFMMPSNLYGFGYLDALRKVFSNAPEPHEDVIPNEEQKSRLDTLYPL